MTTAFKPHPSATPTTHTPTTHTHAPTPAPHPAAHDDQHPVAVVLHFLFATGLGHLLMIAVFLCLIPLFWPPARVVLGPPWRLLTGGLVLRQRGPWDSTWLDSAPDRPQSRPNFRGEPFPRTRWAKMPGYQRMFVRWAVAVYVWVLIAYPIPVMVVTGLVGTTLVVFRILRTVQDWALKQVVGLFAAGAAGLLGYADRDPASWIAVPHMRITPYPVAVSARVLRTVRRLPGIGDRLEHFLGALWVPVLRIPLDQDDARVLISLDAELTNRPAIEEVKNLAKARLPEGPWEAAHKERDTMITLKHPKRPPSQVWYTADQNQQYAIDEVPIGQAATVEKDAKGKDTDKHTWKTLPLKRLTPHAVISASTGWCKTTTANVYVAHTAGNGGFDLINDPKRVGYVRAFGDLPNVRIRTTIEGWIDNVETFYAEMQRRYALVERFPEIQDNPELYFQPWFLITDERGSYVSEIKSWWKNEGEKGLPEVLRLEKIILWQGRAAGMYVLNLAQQANLDVFLDSDGRDNHMARIASGPQTRSSWMMLFPGLAKVKVMMKKGRAMLGIGPDDIVEIQLAQVSDEDARAFAKAGAAIAEMENKERAKRIRALQEAGVPAGDSSGSPGKIAGYVPGQEGDAGTEDMSSENSGKGDWPVIQGDGDNDQEMPQRPPLSLVGDGHNRQGKNMTESDMNSDPESLIVGLEAAAKLLGMSEENFKKARQRRPISGETRRGVSPAWVALDLKEWRSQAPRQGRSATSE